MEVMRQREDSRQLDGRVEIDDAYLGGELSGGKSGRGSENKVPFIAAVALDSPRLHGRFSAWVSSQYFELSTGSLSGVLCLRHNMTFQRELYAQTRQEDAEGQRSGTGSSAAQVTRRSCLTSWSKDR
jgi:hypothetical protein